MKEKSEASKSAATDSVIEIPVGKYASSLRKNPWVLATIVLALALVLVIIFRSPTNSTVSGGGPTIDAATAGQKLVSFINSRGQGTAQVVSSEKNGQFYQVTVSYNGQNIPVYVTTDGNYLVSDLVPLSSNGTTPSAQQPATGPVTVTTGDSPKEGSTSAKVTIVEFTDFQCPFCGRFYTDTYAQLKKDYIDTGKVLLVVKDFPLTNIHPNAEKAAEAASCVREQLGDGGFFKMHDKMFSNQNDLSVDNLKKWARELDVDGKKFDTCLDSGKYADAVAADEKYGESLGVSGTPAFFINGVAITGAQPYSVFKQAIDAALAK